jgi:AraC-like DNA-binding protein
MSFDMIKTIIPQSKVLQKHIKCIYLYKGEAASNLNYLAFPHFNTGLSFFKNAEIDRKNWNISIKENSSAKIKIEVLGKYLNPVMVQLSGKIEEISIIFKPLGINRYIDENYIKIAPNFSQEYNNQNWLDIGALTFKSKNRINYLEECLLSQMKANSEIDLLEESLNLLTDFDTNKSVSDIAKSLNYNLKSFQRHFHKHMGCSPTEYKRIVRFRNAIKTKLNSNSLKTLTDVSYENNFFDQSYFVKEFRKLTNHNPKEFFKEIRTLGDEKLIWEIL